MGILVYNKLVNNVKSLENLNIFKSIEAID